MLYDSCVAVPVTAYESMYVVPQITSISPDVVMVGSTNVPITINGSGFVSPTVNLPAGVTLVPNTQASTNVKIVFNINVSINATIGPNSITVTANRGCPSFS